MICVAIVKEELDKSVSHITSMLPLAKRGNVPQTLCHTALPATMLPRYLNLARGDESTQNLARCQIRK